MLTTIIGLALNFRYQRSFVWINKNIVSSVRNIAMSMILFQNNCMYFMLAIWFNDNDCINSNSKVEFS